MFPVLSSAKERSWSFTTLSEKFREKQQRSVGTIYRSVTVGSSLIERGERLTEEKLAMLKAHEAEVERTFAREESRWRSAWATLGRRSIACRARTTISGSTGS